MSQRDRRRSPARWVADDLKKMNRPRTIPGTLRRHPRILLDALIFGLIACGLLALLLLAFGNLDAFGDYVAYPVLATGPFIGGRIYANQNRSGDEQ